MVPEVISHGFTQTLKLQTLWRFSHIHYKPLCSTAVNHHNFVMSHLQVIETIKKRPRKGLRYILANYSWTVWQLCKVLRILFILFFSHSFTSTLSHIASEYSEKSPGTSALFLFLFMSLLSNLYNNIRKILANERILHDTTTLTQLLFAFLYDFSSRKWKWHSSVLSDSLWPHGL